MKYVIVVALLLSACGNVPGRPAAPMTVGECMWSRGALGLNAEGEFSPDYYALQSCEAEIRRNQEKQRVKSSGN